VIFHLNRNALTEVCVLADVLAIAKEKRYIVLDHVPQDSLETKPMVQVYARKKVMICLCLIPLLFIFYDAISVAGVKL
jgi:hypothetical protein